ncbi:MAG: DUF2085 domain-containing protein [Ktedonobacteraceae bacterium]
MATQSIYPQPAYPAPQTRMDLWMQKVGDFFLHTWVLLIIGVLGLILLATVSVPILAYFGLDSISKPIFDALHIICAQIPSHSFYMLGHQLGMCARNISIYGAMFVSAVIFQLSKKRLPGIPWWLWALMLIPIAVDGLSQTFGLRESTWELRVLTGALFGLANMWFALPFIQKTINEMLIPEANATR